MARLADGDVPSPLVSILFRTPGKSVSVGICMLIYMVTFFGVQFWMRFKKIHNREWVECHKKAWIQLLNLLHVYLYNRHNVATVIILWVCTLAHCGTLVLCILNQPRMKFFKIAMTASLGLSLLNWIIHWLTRTFTSGTRGWGGYAGITKN